jgi:hypothetical protein
MSKLFKFMLLSCVVLYITVKFKHVVMPVAETGTAVVDVLVDKVVDGVDTLVKEAEEKKGKE